MEENNTPQYVPTGKEVTIKDCVDNTKTNQLIKDIMKADIPFKDKQFLIMAAQRHLVFNYKNIAEYYAKADKKIQKLMEDSALVIIDIDDAIANNFAKLYNKIDKLEGEK